MKNKITVVCVALFFGALSLLAAFLPRAEYLKSERRRPAAFPEISYASISGGTFMSSFETYSQDNFPFREAFRTVKSFVNNYVLLRMENNGIYMDGGYISQMLYPVEGESLERAADRFNSVYESYLSEANEVYFSLIPDKNKYLGSAPAADYDGLEGEMASLLPYMKHIKISDLLSREDYYKTDTHWRQEKIGDVAERLANEMGRELSFEYEVKELDVPFYGVYAGQWALPVKADRLFYVTNPIIDALKVYNYENDTEGGVYDMDAATGDDAYEMFLSGPISLMEIENPQAERAGHLIIFRDSFGSSLAPLLAQCYERVTLIDIRYISPQYLSAFVDFSGADVLFLYSSLVLANSETLR